MFPPKCLHFPKVPRRQRGESLIALTLMAALGATAAAADEPTGTDQAPIAVQIVTATPALASRKLRLTGEIVARDAISLSFPSGGRLIEIFPRAGQRVAAGEVLARVDPVQFQAQLTAAEAGLTRAEADLAQAADEADRQARLLRQGATTRAQSDTAQAARDVAQAARDAAQAALDSARNALEDTTLFAPVAGTVTARNAEAGQVLAPAQTVLDLASDSGLDALFAVPEAMLAGAQPDDVRFTLELIDISAPPFTGQVSEISPLVDPATSTVELRAQLDGHPPGVVLGAAVRGIGSPPEQARIALPVWSLVALDQGAAVWVVDPETMRVSRQKVAPLRYSSDAVVLAEGLAPGALVIGRGAQLMYEGREVRDAASQAPSQSAPSAAHSE